MFAAVWQNGTLLCKQANSDEGTARDWLASMMDVLAGMGPQAGGAAPPTMSTVGLANGSFPPLATTMEEQQQQLADLLGAGAKMQQQQQMAGIAELLAAAGGTGGEIRVIFPRLFKSFSSAFVIFFSRIC